MHERLIPKEGAITRALRIQIARNEFADNLSDKIRLSLQVIRIIRIAIVEDDDRFAAVLSEYLDRYSAQFQTVFRTKRFTDGYAIVDGYRPEFDIILMDIEMGLMDGMEAAREIRKTDENVIIIFITNMAQFAIQGYAVSALDYVLKPVKYVAFSETLKKAISRLKKTLTGAKSMTGKRISALIYQFCNEDDLSVKRAF